MADLLRDLPVWQRIRLESLSKIIPADILLGMTVPNILVESVSVDFPIYGSHSRSLKKQIVSQATGGRVLGGAHDLVVVRALDEVSLEIGRGQRVALVGHNGSGKTTLLRALAGIYRPTSGRIQIEGQVGALLDPVAGMDPDASGAENVYLRGRLLGLAWEDIRRLLPEIVEFTELSDFIDLPIRTYSAGMNARLAFAISTVIRPDILLMDEGIGAGDARFMEKVKVRLEEMAARSPILVFASHDHSLVEKLCNRVVRFEHGRVSQVGEETERPGVPQST